VCVLGGPLERRVEFLGPDALKIRLAPRGLWRRCRCRDGNGPTLRRRRIDGCRNGRRSQNNADGHRRSEEALAHHVSLHLKFGWRTELPRTVRMVAIFWESEKWSWPSPTALLSPLMSGGSGEADAPIRAQSQLESKRTFGR